MNPTLDAVLAQLQPFIQHLRQSGYNVGVDSYQRVYAALLRLSAHDQLNLTRLSSLLAPLLCNSPQEQAEFPQHFRVFFQTLLPVESLEKIDAPTAAPLERAAEKLGWLVFWMGMVLLLPALISVFLVAQNATTTPIDTPVQNTVKTSGVAAVATLTIPISPPAAPNRLLFWTLLTLFAVLALWRIWDALWRQRFLARHATRNTPTLSKYFASLPKPRLFSSVAFQHAAQQLHKHRELDSHHLDIETTIQRSIAAHGMFTPAYRARKALPEYLVLIDRASFHDQHSQLVDALLKELDDYGLFIERYYFDGDPRRCYAARTSSTACTLDSLQARYADYRLLIFADSPQFFDPLGHPAVWLEKLRTWASPVLFTPSTQWDYYTQTLQDSGFLLLTTGQKGLAQLVTHLTRNEIKRDYLADDDYPSLLAQRPLRFLERHAPNPNVVKELLKQLQRYLDEDGFRWLAACAVYPELHWQLTLYLGQGVGWVERSEAQQNPHNHAVNVGLRTSTQPTTGIINEALLLKLTRLPWLRHHYLPNWLRLALLEALPAAQHRAVRQQLETLLQNLHPEAERKEDLSLPLAQHTWRNFWKKDGKLQDHVFLDFMNDSLSVRARLVTKKWFGDFPIRLTALLKAILSIWHKSVLNVIGNTNQVIINQSVDQNTDRFLKLLEAAQRHKEELRQHTQELEAQNDQLKTEMIKLAQRLAQDTQVGTNNPAAIQAVAGLKRGDLKSTADYLREVAQKARHEGESGKGQAASAMRELAKVGSNTDAVQALQRAIDYEPDNALNWNLLGDMQFQMGNLRQAERTFQQAMRITAAASQAQPNDLNLLRDLSVSHNKIGDIQKAQGDLASALVSYRASLTIAERLALHDATNTQWQRDLSVSHNKIGDIQQAQGDLAGALLSFRASLTIAERLAQHDAANTEWQRDLSISHDNIGDIQQAQGDLAGALLSYRASLTIAERLAQHDVANTQWQRDLWVSRNKIGEIQQAQGDLAGALVSYRASLTIAERLAQHDAANTQWQRDLSVSHNKIGDIHLAQGDLAGALVSYRASLTIRERLAQYDAANVQWQTNVVISCWKLAKVSQGEEAKGFLQRGLVILERLTKEERLDANQKGWVQMFRDALAK